VNLLPVETLNMYFEQPAPPRVESMPPQELKQEYTSTLPWMRFQPLRKSGRLGHNKAIFANEWKMKRYPTLKSTSGFGQDGSLPRLRCSERFRLFLLNMETKGSSLCFAQPPAKTLSLFQGFGTIYQAREQEVSEHEIPNQVRHLRKGGRACYNRMCHCRNTTRSQPRHYRARIEQPKEMETTTRLGFQIPQIISIISQSV